MVFNKCEWFKNLMYVPTYAIIIVSNIMVKKKTSKL